MPSYLTHKLEFSIDPLSDTTPAYTDVSAFLVEADWSSGKARDLDDPQAGGATFRLVNTKPGAGGFPQHQFEPEHTAGRFYPNVLPMRRFRWSITADGVTYPQGTYYAQNWQVSYPNPGSTYSETVVSCVDGFGLLQQQPLGSLSPPAATSYEEVVAADSPWGYWKLDEETGGAMNATAGPSGAYRGNLLHVKPNPVVGDSGFAIFSTIQGAYGRAKLDDDSVWVDSGQVSCEGVVYRPSGTGTGMIVLGPFRTPTTADYIFGLDTGGASVWPSAATSVFTSGSHVLSAGHHHVAMTWDGSTLSYYQDGVVVEAVSGPGNAPVAPDTNEFIRIAGDVATASLNGWTLSHAAVYNYALKPAQVSAHATAATSRGYDAQTAGARVASLATNALWSVAGITGGQIVNVEPRMQTGQSTLDEIVATVKAETPFGLFYFNDAGNPAYQGMDYDTTLDTTLGEFEVQYDSLSLVYDDEVWNQSTVSNDLGQSNTASNATSQGQSGTRAQDETGLIINGQAEADLISQAIVDGFSTPMYRIASVDLNGAAQNRRIQILQREIGDVIRIKRRGQGGVANPDIITRILGKTKHLDVSRNLTCTWSLARGFTAGDAHWRLGQVGYGELGQTTVLA